MPNLISFNTTQPSFICKTLDWIPLISTASNLVHIFARSVLKADPNSSYGLYLKNRVILDHVCLILPIMNLLYSALRCIIPYEREYYLETVRKDGLCLERASKELKNDREIVLAAVKQNGLALGFASENLRNDPEIVIEAIKENDFALRYASLALVRNHGFLLRAVKQNPGILLFTPSWVIQIDSKLSMRRLSLKSMWEARLAPDLYRNRAFIIEAIKENGLALKYVSQEFLFHRESQDPSNIARLLGHDRDIILTAVKQNGLALQFAKILDHEIVLEAVKQNGLALQFAYDIPLSSCEENYGRLDVILNDSKFKYDQEIVLAAVKQNGLALQFVPITPRFDFPRIENGLLVAQRLVKPSLRSDLTVCSHAIRQNKEAYEFVNPDMRSLNEVLRAVKAPQEAVYASKVSALALVFRNGF